MIVVGLAFFWPAVFLNETFADVGYDLEATCLLVEGCFFFTYSVPKTLDCLIFEPVIVFTGPWTICTVPVG